MGFRRASARSRILNIGFGALAAVLSTAAVASAVQVSLPANAVINAVGQTVVVEVSIASVTNLEGAAISITYDESIADVDATSDVQRGAFASSCDAPQTNLTDAGRVTVTMACSSMPLNGSGVLLSITFTGKANGVTALSFSNFPLIPNGCQLNEGTPTCEGVNGQLTVGPQEPTNTATATAPSTATATSTPTNTSPAPPTSTSTATATATITDTPTVGPSPTASQTQTASTTPTVTATPSSTFTHTVTFTPSDTPTPLPTATVTSTATITATATATPVPTPRITSGAVGGSTRVFGNGASNIAAPGIEIVAENGNQVIGTGGTSGSGAFTDGQGGIGLIRALEPGERIFPRDTVNGLTGPLVTVGPRPPTAIPALDQYGTAALGVLLALALAWQLAGALRARQR